MRHCSASWFVLGFFVPAGALIVGVCAGAIFRSSGSAGRSFEPLEILIATTGVTLAYVILRLLAELLLPGLRGSRREEQPHELFTPPYDQRRQEWVAARRRRMT